MTPITVSYIYLILNHIYPMWIQQWNRTCYGYKKHILQSLPMFVGDENQIMVSIWEHVLFIFSLCGHPIQIPHFKINMGFIWPTAISDCVHLGIKYVPHQSIKYSTNIEPHMFYMESILGSNMPWI